MSIIYYDKKIFFSYLASLVLLVAGFSFIYVNLFDIDNLLILHFNAFSGIDVLGSKLQVYGIIVAGVALNFFNAFLAAALYYRDRFLSYLLGFNSAFISLLILLVIWVIVSVN